MPEATDETTPAQLRGKAQRMRDIAENCDRQHAPVSSKDWRTAALALEEQAARMERPWLHCTACQARRAVEAQQPAAELRGWGVMQSDGTLLGQVMTKKVADAYSEMFDGESVRVRLTTEGATAQEGESNG